MALDDVRLIGRLLAPPWSMSRRVHGADRVVAALESCAATLSAVQGDAVRAATAGEASGRARQLLAGSAAAVASSVEELRALAASGALQHLPRVRRRGGYHQLRVHYVATMLVARQDIRDVDGLVCAVRGCHPARHLSLRELGLIPAMLRLALLEGLTAVWRRLAPARILEETPRALECLDRWAKIDPAALVDRLSLDAPAEAALRRDPAGLHDRCDLVTRDRYRAAVGEVARWSSSTGSEVASRVVELAAGAAASAGRAAGSAHVGFYLLGPGRPALEASIGARPPARARLARWLGRRAVALHLAAVAAASLAMTAALLVVQGATGGAAVALAILAGPAAVAAFWQIAQLGADTLHALTAARPPLPRLDLADGIPEGHRTLVVVPCLLRSTAEVDHLVRVLQEHAASAAGLGLRFCLLGDFGDAPREVMPGDEEILAHARSTMDALDRSAGDPSRRELLLLHRPRRWNPGEGVWMGHERKRGKLADLNRVILGAEPTAFFPTPDARLVRDVAFVITLDVDNRMAKGTALRLIETIAHPLNRAEGADGEPTRHGYGVLQPRIAANPLGERASRYEGWAAGDLGTEEPPDKRNHLHQDLFGEASYFGKGIYDVAAFERSTRGRFEDNTILSHDLPEGCFARTAVVADACVLESSPADYPSEASRRHRWIRGDWQNLLWMLARSRPGAAGARGLSLLSRWRIVDNVRRSLMSVALLWLLAVGLLLAAAPGRWVAAVLSILVVPRVSSAIWDGRKLVLRALAGRIGARGLVVGAARLVHQAALRACLAAALIPFEACLTADAAARSTWRTLRRGRGRLAWVPFDGGRAGRGSTLAGHAHLLRGQLAVAIALAFLVAALRPGALVVAAPLLLLWLAAPALVWWVGRP